MQNLFVEVILYSRLSKLGMVRWRLNCIWNKEGGFSLSQIWEYKDQKAYIRGQESVGIFYNENTESYLKVTVKRVSSWAINFLDYYD